MFTSETIRSEQLVSVGQGHSRTTWRGHMPGSGKVKTSYPRSSNSFYRVKRIRGSSSKITARRLMVGLPLVLQRRERSLPRWASCRCVCSAPRSTTAPVPPLRITWYWEQLLRFVQALRDILLPLLCTITPAIVDISTPPTQPSDNSWSVV
jgi:hypothetical protein